MDIDKELPIKKKRGRKPKNEKKEEETGEGAKLDIKLDNSSDIVELEKKKRGRPKNDNDKELRKRNRRKKYEIDSIKTCRERIQNKDGGDRVVFSENNENLNHLEQQEIPFGGVNITMYKSKKTNINEIRKNFDEIFKLDETEKAPNVLLQENGIKFNFQNYQSDESDSEIEEAGTAISDAEDNEDDIEQEIETIDKKLEKLNVSEETIYHKKLYKVLDNFIGKDNEWPSKTKILCWWCCHSFDTIPIPCPVEYDELRDRFKVKGIFCGWSCAASYSIENYNVIQLLYLLKQKVCGAGSEIIIKPAPPRICLKSFGGEMSISAFRKASNENTNFVTKISTDYISYINQEILEIFSEQRKRKSKKNLN